LKYGFLINRVYLVGWSAGGTAAAWALTHDFSGVFNLAVIMDAELTGPTENSTHTEYSVFTSAQFASQVSIPHLLIWGRDNSGTISIQSATGWVKNAKPGLSRLDPFPYSHTWIGTSIEPTIRRDISEFFNAQAVGYTSLIDASKGGVSIPTRILTNSQLDNATYNPANHTFTIVTTGQAGTVGVVNMVVPKAALDGEPIVTMDGSPIDSSYAEDGDKYYLYFTYPQSTHTFSVSGQNAVPEFPALPMLQQLTFLAALAAVLILKRRRKLSSPRDQQRRILQKHIHHARAERPRNSRPDCNLRLIGKPFRRS